MDNISCFIYLPRHNLFVLSMYVGHSDTISYKYIYIYLFIGLNIKLSETEIA